MHERLVAPQIKLLDPKTPQGMPSDPGNTSTDPSQNRQILPASASPTTTQVTSFPTSPANPSAPHPTHSEPKPPLPPLKPAVSPEPSLSSELAPSPTPKEGPSDPHPTHCDPTPPPSSPSPDTKTSPNSKNYEICLFLRDGLCPCGRNGTSQGRCPFPHPTTCPHYLTSVSELHPHLAVN